MWQVLLNLWYDTEVSSLSQQNIMECKRNLLREANGEKTLFVSSSKHDWVNTNIEGFII